jgi:hypothetical protein
VKALTLTQPWASLVMAGVKRIETRAGRTSYRGPLVIHAANRSASGKPLGAALGIVQLVDVVPIIGPTDWGNLPADYGTLTPLERELGDYSPGRYAWLLADPEPFPEPVPCRGSLGLWDYPS